MRVNQSVSNDGRQNYKNRVIRMSGGGDPINVRTVIGDLLDAKEQYLCHQCNCVTVKGAHLSGDVFDRFPHANIYIDRLKTGKRDEPGTIIVRGGSGSSRMVINMLAQYYPGKSRFATDTGALRQRWFQSCLNEIAELPYLESLAFPYQIGCGAAGGHWPTYHQMILKFAKTVPHAQITIYQLPSTTATSHPINISSTNSKTNS